MALILAAVMAVSCLTTILLAASKPWTEIDLGSLSQYYETGTNADPGRISNVDGDSGGTSYGLYMFVEKTVTSFMDWLKKSDSAVYRGFGDRLYNAYAYNTSGQYYPGFGSNFKNTWQEIGRNNRTEFAQAQTDFWRDTQYTQLVANVEGQYKGFDIDNYSNALKNVFWSRSVHHGVGATYGSTKNTDGMSGATGVICRAFKALGGSYAMARCLSEKLGKPLEEMSFEELCAPAARRALGDITFVTATDGNHGRGVAWAARLLGQKAVQPDGGDRFESEYTSELGTLTLTRTGGFSAVLTGGVHVRNYEKSAAKLLHSMGFQFQQLSRRQTEASYA